MFAAPRMAPLRCGVCQMCLLYFWNHLGRLPATLLFTGITFRQLMPHTLYYSSVYFSAAFFRKYNVLSLLSRNISDLSLLLYRCYCNSNLFNWCADRCAIGNVSSRIIHIGCSYLARDELAIFSLRGKCHWHKYLHRWQHTMNPCYHNHHHYHNDMWHISDIEPLIIKFLRCHL